jgi:hypothetical protein
MVAEWIIRLDGVWELLTVGISGLWVLLRFYPD